MTEAGAPAGTVQLSLLVPVDGPDRLVRRALAAAAACTSPSVEVVRLEDHRTATPGLAYNRAVRRSRGDFVAIVDGSEAVTPELLDSAMTALVAAPRAGCASWLGATGHPGGVAAAEPRLANADDLVASPWTLARIAVYRRRALEAVDGFDQTLPGLVDWDLRLRLHGAGHQILLEPGVVPLTAPDDDVRLREALRPDRYLPSIRQVLLRHQLLFRQHMATALLGRGRLNEATWQERGAPLTQRWQEGRERLAGVLGELRSLQAELVRRGQKPFDWSSLRRTTPVSRNWGLERGRPVDRHYIEGFVAAHAGDIRGAVLEMLDAGLTERFGADRVTRSDVLDIDPGNLRATIVGDLRGDAAIPAAAYDCFILTQTLHLIDDVQAAVRQAYEAVAPGGVVLATLPAASMFASEYGERGDHWRVTTAGARWLFERAFGPGNVTVQPLGNVLATTASLYGLCCDDLDPAELDAHDPDYPLVVAVRAVKAAPASRVVPASAARRPVILLYHRAAAAAPDPHELGVDPARLREQLQAIRERWHPMTLAALAAAHAAGAAPDGAVALTFDDGYLDNLDVALPLLEAFEVPATIFVTTEALNRPHVFWWDMIASMLLGAGPLPRALDLRIMGETIRLPTGTDVERRHAHDDLHRRLTASVPAVRDDLLFQLTAWCPTGPSVDRPRRMTSAEVQSLARHPLVEVGAHSVHHRNLAALGPDDLHREVFECRTELERLLDQPVTAFAYPFGSWNAEVARVTVEAAYETAVTCEARPLRSFERAHALPRAQVANVAGDAFQDWLGRLQLRP